MKNLSVDAKASALKELDEIFDPLINHVALFIGRLEAAGQDPSNYFDVEENEFVNYVAILQERQEAKQKAVEQVMNEFDRLSTSEISDDQDPDVDFWKAVLLITKQVLSEGIRIKIGDFSWDSKKPLHGLGSLLSDIKDAVMKAIGVDADSELGKILRNPGSAVLDLPENARREVERTLENAKREADKVLENASREAGRVVANSKREVDRAATNVAREVGKIIPKKIIIRKPKFKW